MNGMLEDFEEGTVFALRCLSFFAGVWTVLILPVILLRKLTRHGS